MAIRNDTTAPKIDGCTPEEYAATWGSTDKDGVYFYNFSSESVPRTKVWLAEFVAVIDRQIVRAKALPSCYGEKEINELTALREHVSGIVPEDTIKELLDYAAFIGAGEEALDDEVHDVAQEADLSTLNTLEDEDDQEEHIDVVERAASNINNNGFASQIEFLLANGVTPERIKTLLEEGAETEDDDTE